MWLVSVLKRKMKERKRRLQVRFRPPGAAAPPTAQQGRNAGSQAPAHTCGSSRLGGGGLQNSLVTSLVGSLKSCSSLRTTDLGAKLTAKESGQMVAELVTAVRGWTGTSTGHHRRTAHGPPLSSCREGEPPKAEVPDPGRAKLLPPCLRPPPAPASLPRPRLSPSGV